MSPAAMRAIILLLCLTIGQSAHAADAIELLGRGVQIYGCTATDGSFAWKLTGPDATLTDAQGMVAGHHFAGPSWQASDGSLVVGEVLAASAGAKGAVPWLVLHAKSHTGAGAFATVKYIVRSRTEGGAAPAGGCDAAHAGASVRVPYSATYTFFP